uniref:Uncharacterized protein n=1 Tax=Heterorhabditis bacteriophora TaxID=37862 RepID=A0A1I7WX64_HETBA
MPKILAFFGSDNVKMRMWWVDCVKKTFSLGYHSSILFEGYGFQFVI